MKKIILSVFVLSIFLPTLAFASFDANLKYGDKNSSVLELQNFLQSKGFLINKPNGYFGISTKKAVSDFQKKYNIKPASGIFGSVTRTQANKLNSIDIANKLNSLDVTIDPQQNPTGNQEDLFNEINIKNNAISITDQIITNYTSLNAFLSSDINIMKPLVDNLSSSISPTSNVTTQLEISINQGLLSFLDFTKKRLTRITEARDNGQQILLVAQKEKFRLQSQPLSYFLTYKIPIDTQNAVTSFTTIQQNFVSDFNDYSSLTQKYAYLLKQTTNPAIQNNIPRATHCTVNMITSVTSYINCY